MTPEERTTMQEHSAYWTNLANEDIAIAVGPVADPAGFWGLGIIEVGTEAEAKKIRDNDPATKSNHGFKSEIFPMPRLILRE